MALDVWSAKGRAANRRASRMADAVATMWGVEWIGTRESRPARVDGVFVQDGAIVGVAECKSRSKGREYFRQQGDTYLITHQKLVDGREAGRLLAVPFFVLALLEPDRVAVAWKVSSAEGAWLFPFAIRTTTTAASVNGGSVTRENAYLPFKHADVIPLGSCL